MENYCRIFIHIDEQDAFFSKLDITEAEKENIIHGVKLEEKSSVTGTIKNKSKNYNDLLGNDLMTPLVSEKLKNVIELLEGPNNLQFIPVEMPKRKYWLMNILNVIACFDWEKSIYTTYTGTKVLRKITKLVLKEDSLVGIHIFKMKEDPFHIFVSKEMHDKLIESSITGVEFIYTYDLTNNSE